MYTLVESSKYCPDDAPVDILLLLIRYNAAISYIHPDNYKTPLHQAVKYGILQFVQVMLQNGADPNVVDKKKRVVFNMIAKQKSDSSQKIKHTLQEANAHTHWKQ